MQDFGLTIVLSGHIRELESADLRPFWLGFIELQRRLPTCAAIRQILAHSWNPEYKDLVELVYGPDACQHEKQTTLYPEFYPGTQAIDSSNAVLLEFNSAWTEESVQSVLSMARSRASSINLLETVPSEESSERVLLVPWNLAQTNNFSSHQLVIDTALPQEYLYLSYSPEVDEGYPDSWVVGPCEKIRIFKDYDQFVLNCLTGSNHYLELFTQKGWPRSFSRNKLQKFLSHSLVRSIRRYLLNRILEVKQKFEDQALLHRLVRKTLRESQRILDIPPITSENSFVPEKDRKPSIFQMKRALNCKSLLKFFILSEGLRDQTRFLTDQDFELSAQSGQLINPQPFVLFLWNATDYGIESIKDLLANSTIPIAAVYLVTQTKVQEALVDPESCLSIQNLSPETNTLRGQLECAFERVKIMEWKQLPVIILPSQETYQACLDWCYLNALLKYISWTEIDYVCLEPNEQPSERDWEFPGLKSLNKNGMISFHKAIGTFIGIFSLMKQLKGNLDDLTLPASTSGLKFPNLVVNRVLF